MAARVSRLLGAARPGRAWARRAGLVLAGAVLLLVGVGVGSMGRAGRQAAGATSLLQGSISDANFIVNSIVSNGSMAGAIAAGASATPSYIDPYEANYAIWGLARAYGLTGYQTYADDAWSALQWYATSEDPSDYDAVFPEILAWNGSTYTANSTAVDSFPAEAGTFLVAALETYEATGNTPDLSNLFEGLQGAESTIIDSFNSTYLLAEADPPWGSTAYYTLDDSEAYAGLRAAAILFEDLGSGGVYAADAQRATSYATALQTGMTVGCGTASSSQAGRNTEGLLDPATGLFTNGRNADGVLAEDVSPVTPYFFPDMDQQAWPVALGDSVTPETPLLTPAQAARSVEFISAQHGTIQFEWDEPDSATLTLNPDYGGTGPYYNPMMALAFDAVGDTMLGSAGLDRIRGYGISTQGGKSGRGWPYSTEVAGQMIIASLWSVANVEDSD